MTMVINGSGTITGLTAGGLPDATIQQADLATGVAGTGPAFSAYRSGSSQSVTSGVWTKVQLNSEDFDTASCFDSTTNYRFTPTVAGYYLITGAIYFATSTSNVNIDIYKNGASTKINYLYASGDLSMQMTQLIYLNGSTDYVELYGRIVGSSTAFSNAGNSTYMIGSLARAA